MAAGELHVDSVDVFCEGGVYDVAQTRRILQAGAEIGLAGNFHGEELSRLGSAEVGAAAAVTGYKTHTHTYTVWAIVGQ